MDLVKYDEFRQNLYSTVEKIMMIQNCLYNFIDITVLSNFVFFFLEGEEKRERDRKIEKILHTVLCNNMDHF